MQPLVLIRSSLPTSVASMTQSFIWNSWTRLRNTSWKRSLCRQTGQARLIDHYFLKSMKRRLRLCYRVSMGMSELWIWTSSRANTVNRRFTLSCLLWCSIVGTRNSCILSQTTKNLLRSNTIGGSQQWQQRNFSRKGWFSWESLPLSFFFLCYASWWRFVPCVACVACVACVTCVPWCCGCRVSMLSIMWSPSRYATKHMPNSVVSPGPG